VTRRLLLGYLGLTLLVLLSFEIPLGVQNARTERRDLEAKVEHDASALASVAAGTTSSGSIGSGSAAARSRALAAVAALAERYRRDTGGRVLIVDKNGVALVDTDPSGPGRRTYASRPEIATALRGDVASGVRHSTTLGTNLLYVATPIASGGVVTGAVRITYPTSAVDARITRYWLLLLAVAAVVLGLAALVGARIGSFVIRPLRGVEAAATAVGDGDLSARAPEDEGPPEVRSLAAVFNDTVAKLELLLRSQSDFVADASHQLRTPLTALHLRLENLERDVAAAGREDLEGALAEVERLSGLVESLLALARADAGAEPPARVDVASLVRDRLDAWSALSDERGLRLVAQIDGSASVRASESRLRQVLDNLIENAFEASPPGGSVTVSAAGSELRVRDQGPGLSPEELQRAFDRFWRARPGEGSGLGLAIVKRLVEADGGTVELRSPPAGGLEAVVRLRSG
jgi:signal transduction histidine kinase